MSKLRDTVERAINNISTPVMGGDNLAVFLCSHFDNPYQEQDENGWSEDAVTGCDEVIGALVEAVMAIISRECTTTTKAVIHDAIASELSGTFDCTRVWEAWNIGTMSQNDFVPITERIDEIVDGVVSALVDARKG